LRDQAPALGRAVFVMAMLVLAAAMALLATDLWRVLSSTPSSRDRRVR
jgi:hypothetical protein